MDPAWQGLKIWAYFSSKIFSSYEKSNILIYYIKNLWQQSEFKINLGFLTTTKVVEMTNQPSIWDKIGSKNSNIHTYWVLLSRMIVYNVDILIIRIAIRWVRLQMIILISICFLKCKIKEKIFVLCLKIFQDDPIGMLELI